MFWLVKCLSEVGKPWLFTDPEIAPDVSWVTAVVAGVHFIVSIWLAQRSWTAAQRFSVKAVEQSILLQWACLVLSFICGVILMIRVYNLQVIGPMEMMRRNLLIGTSVAIVSHVILSLYAVLIFRSFNVHIQDVNLLMFGPASDDATYYRPLPPSLPASNMV